MENEGKRLISIGFLFPEYFEGSRIYVKVTQRSKDKFFAEAQSLEKFVSEISFLGYPANLREKEANSDDYKQSCDAGEFIDMIKGKNKGYVVNTFRKEAYKLEERFK